MLSVEVELRKSFIIAAAITDLLVPSAAKVAICSADAVAP